MFVALFALVALFAVTNADHHQHTAFSKPYAVSVENFRGFHVGGGVLVAEDVVLTTAHNINGVTANLNVRLGSNVLGVGGQLINVKKNCPVSGYDYQSRVNDVTVLRLKKKAVLNEKVGLAKVPALGKSFGSVGELSGWGYNVQGAFDTIGVKKVDEAKCKHIYNEETVPDSALCVDYLDDKHSCLDAVIGNPLVSDGTVYGVVSAAGACDLKGFPAIVAKIPIAKLQADIDACN